MVRSICEGILREDRARSWFVLPKLLRLMEAQDAPLMCGKVPRVRAVPLCEFFAKAS